MATMTAAARAPKGDPGRRRFRAGTRLASPRLAVHVARRRAGEDTLIGGSMRTGLRRRLMLRVSAIVVMVVLMKLAVHAAGWEVLTVNPLFTGIVAANIFLMGFLLNGVLSDYKESERLPGELGASLQNLAQEAIGLALAKPGRDVAPLLEAVESLSRGLFDWFHKRQRTAALMDGIDALTPRLAELEEWAQATLVARLKQEQANLRRTVIRIHTIRETSFVSAGYLLADLTTVLLGLGLVLARIEPFYESLFFVCVITWLMVFLLLLIRDLDNPFGYYERASGADVSLHPLLEATRRIEAARYGAGLPSASTTCGAGKPAASS